MSYLVLARKWRPQTFADLVGQEHVSRTLSNAIESGRIAHAFLFTGARGVGKTSSARILAKALNCEQGLLPEPCNECSSCREITSGSSVDVLEIDGASNTGVDDVRELREAAKYLPSRSRFRIFIIDEVHMLSTNAFNALLKTLEEPPAHVKFIFATTEPHKLPVTILSRCQRFDFRKIGLTPVVERLRFIVDHEGIAVSDGALTLIARKGEGSMRDSLSVLDQVLAFSGESVDDEEVAALLGVVDRRLLTDIAAAVFARDPAGVLAGVKRVDAYGYSMRQFCQELIDHFRNLLVASVAADPAQLIDLPESELAEVRTQAQATAQEELQRHLAILIRCDAEMAHGAFPRLVLEMALVRMATLPPVIAAGELLERLARLEKRLAGAPAPSGASSLRDVSESFGGKPAPPAPQPASRPASPAPAPPRVAAAPPSPSGAGGTWEGFVAFVKQKRAAVGALLEHGVPLKVSPRLLELAYPEESFNYTRMRDPETLATVAALAADYFGEKPEVRVVAPPAGADGLPASLVEKKKREQSERSTALKEKVHEHPLVSAAKEIFGGDVRISEPEKP